MISPVATLSIQLVLQLEKRKTSLARRGHLAAQTVLGAAALCPFRGQPKLCNPPTYALSNGHSFHGPALI